jgi:cytochrome b pre-mRNA-processing protein 6
VFRGCHGSSATQPSGRRDPGSVHTVRALSIIDMPNILVHPRKATREPLHNTPTHSPWPKQCVQPILSIATLTHVSKAAKHYTRLLALWPKDALRPNIPFTRTIEAHGRPFGVKPLPRDPSDKSAIATAQSPSTSTLTPPPNAQREQAQINALYSLLENRYSKKYVLSPGVLAPASAPQHYERLMREIEKAPGKSWWEAKLDEWKMKIRWS